MEEMDEEVAEAREPVLGCEGLETVRRCIGRRTLPLPESGELVPAR